MTADVSGPVGQPIEPAGAPSTDDAALIQRRIEQVNRGAARAAVLGVNDGLVTTLALVLGLAGAAADPSAVRLAGVASLIAGALSMAAGEWVSVRAQVELYEGLLGQLRSLVARNPGLLLDTLTDRLEEAGLDTATAEKASTEVGIDRELFFRFTARNVFDVNPDELGSPWVAAVSSLLLFAAGGAVPLLPWFVADGSTAVAATVGLTSIVAAIVGAYIGRSGGTSVVRASVRQLVIVALAAGVTYGIGAALGTTIG